MGRGTVLSTHFLNFLSQKTKFSRIMKRGHKKLKGSETMLFDKKKEKTEEIRTEAVDLSDDMELSDDLLEMASGGVKTGINPETDNAAYFCHLVDPGKHTV